MLTHNNPSKTISQLLAEQKQDYRQPYPDQQVPADTIKLKHNRPLNAIIQHLAEKYYLQPYPGQQVQPGTIARPHHGVLHAVSAMLADQLFIKFLKKYCPEDYSAILREYNDGQDLDETDEKLLALALFCHDIGNKSEYHKNEEDHADIFRKEMTALDFPKEKIERFAKALANKDNKKDNTQITDIFRMRIHDGDCWEFLRMCSSHQTFKISELEIVKLLQNKLSGDQEKLAAALKDVSEHVEYYFELTHFFYNHEKIHQACEFSSECVTTLEKAINDYQRFRIKRLMPAEEKINIPSLNNEELFFGRLEEKTYEQIKTAIFTAEEKANSAEAQVDVATEFENGLYLRCIRSVDEETTTLAKNAEILKSLNISDETQLKKYFTNEGENNTATLLPGFLVRPMTKIQAGQSISIFSRGSAGVILDPKKLLIAHRYKDNVLSHGINTHSTFARMERKKTLSEDTLTKKLAERETRRRGETWDNHNRHYGTSSTAHNETWGHYDIETAAVRGILVADNPVSAQNAIALYHACKRPVPFYRYSPVVGLVAITQDEVLYWAGIKKQNVDYLPHSYFIAKKLEQTNIIYPSNAESPSYTLYLQDISEISCSTSEYTPSAEHPIKYKFTIIKNGNPVQGEGFVKNGIPVIQINNLCYYDRNNLLPKIATTYQTQKIENCNNILTKLRNFFASEGIHDLRFAINPRGKSTLTLSYTTASTCKKSVADVLELLGGHPCQIKPDSNGKKIQGWLNQHTAEILPSNPGKIYIKLPVIQSVDLICSSLQALDQRTPEYPPQPKPVQSVQPILQEEKYSTADSYHHLLTPQQQQLPTQPLNYVPLIPPINNSNSHFNLTLIPQAKSAISTDFSRFVHANWLNVKHVIIVYSYILKALLGAKNYDSGVAFIKSLGNLITLVGKQLFAPEKLYGAGLELGKYLAGNTFLGKVSTFISLLTQLNPLDNRLVNNGSSLNNHIKNLSLNYYEFMDSPNFNLANSLRVSLRASTSIVVPSSSFNLLLLLYLFEILPIDAATFALSCAGLKLTTKLIQHYSTPLLKTVDKVIPKKTQEYISDKTTNATKKITAFFNDALNEKQGFFGNFLSAALPSVVPGTIPLRQH